MKPKWLSIIMVLALAAGITVALPAQKVEAAACFFTSNVSPSGNWSTNSSWNISGAGCPASGSTYPGATAGNDDIVTIANGDTITLDVTPANALLALSVGQGTSGVLTIGNSATARTLSVVGNVTVNPGATLQADTTLLHSSTNTLRIGGNFANNGAVDLINGSSGEDRVVNVIFYDTGARTISGNSITFHNVTVNSGATVNLSQDVVVEENASGTDGVFTVNGTLNTGTHTVSGANGGFTLASSGTLGIGSPDGITSSGATGSIQTAVRNFDSGGNYTYNGSAAQVTGNGLPATVHGLTIANSAGVSLSQDVTVNGTFSLAAGYTLDVGANTLTLNGATTACGVPVTGGTINSSATGTVIYNGSGQPICQGTYGNLTTANSNTKDLQGTTTVLGNVTIGASTTLWANNNNMTVAGNWTNNGAFTPSGTTVTFNGSSAQTIGGSAGTTFNNLTINNTSADTDGVSLGANQTVNGVLTLTDGLLKPGNYDLTIGSGGSVSGGSAASMVVTDVDGTQTGRLCKAWGSGAFTYPIGDARGATEYSPFTFSSTGASGRTCFRVVDAANPNMPNGVSNYLTRYWVGIVAEGTVGTYDISATFINSASDPQGTTGDVVGSTGSMSPKKWDGSAPWAEGGVMGAPTFTWNGLTSLSEFTAFDIALAATLASFDAQSQAGHVLVTWETVSEAGNAGFNLYRTTSAEPPTPADLLASVPSQAPGSTQGFAYAYQDQAVTPGETTWYWLADVSLGGVATLHGPVSVVYVGPTAVTLSGLEATQSAPALAWPWLVALLAATSAGAALVWRRRSAAA